MTTQPDLQSCLNFLKNLIQTESLPGQEESIAKLVGAEMERLGYDRVYWDEAGNVIGVIRGRGRAPALMFNTHLDHVDVGDHDRWPHPPFGAEIHQDKVWGRGAVDIKGPLAAQVYGVAGLKARSTPPPGDVLVSAVVQEEVGGLGARHLATHLEVPLCVVGEPSRNQLRRGHRGRIEMVLHVKGRSVHASVPEKGINPLEVIAAFIQRLRGLKMREDPLLGASSVAPTLIRTDQTSANVVPAEVWLTLDWRSVPGESSGEVRDRLDLLARECQTEGSQASVAIPVARRVSYKGLKWDIPAAHPAFVTDAEHPIVEASQEILAESIGLEEECGFWRFATDGGHFAEAGSTIIGFGPGDELLAHTVDESIVISDLGIAMKGNQALAAELAAKCAGE